jgi:hypothetical protein
MTQCIPTAVGVPGLIFRPPVWRGIEQSGDTVWKSDPPTPSISVPSGLDDPRWQGGLRIGHPPAVGGAEAATFRAVWSDTGGRALYLSWHVRVDVSSEAGGDVIWVGLEPAAGDPIIINIEPFQNLETKLSDTIAGLTVFTLNPGADTVTRWPGSFPDWIMANTRRWYDSPTRTWAVQMRVPINAADTNLGVNLADTFRMWYEMTVLCPGTTCIKHRFPYGASVVTAPGLPPVVHVAPLSQWESFHLSTGPGDPVCPTTGFVSLNIADIGTANVPSSRIDPVTENTFEAKPLNKTAAPIPAGAISAFFRMANWGSIADPNTSTWDAVPTSGGTSNPATNTAEILVNDKGLNRFTWTLTPDQRKEFKPPIGTGPKDPHQCVLVELSGAGIVFQPASTWKNMNVRPASRLAQVAEINTVGLGPGPGGSPERDTYLLVEKRNMPAPSGRDGEGGGEGGGDDGRPPGPNIRRAGDHGGGDHGGGDGGGSDEDGGDGDGRDPDDLLEEAAKAALTEDQRLDATMPTYRVHVYHDTGETVVHNGVTYRCLTPGTSFGHWVTHDGSLDGWRDDIQGATRIGPNFYRLRAPAEGVVQVVTVIEAVERPGGLLGWLRWLLEWLLRLLRRLLRLLRRRP